MYQALSEAELTAAIGAAPHERSDTRTALRNGHRPRTLTTPVGDLELRIPTLRAGSFPVAATPMFVLSPLPARATRRSRCDGGAGR
jgi:hypothetical protein